MHLRRSLSQGQLLLGQGNPLRHAEDVRIADRNHVHPTVKILTLDAGLLTFDRVRVFRRHVFRKHVSQQPKLLLLGVVHPLVHRAHHTATTLQQRNRRPNREFLIAVTHAHVRRTDELFACCHAEPKQLHQRCARLLVRQRHQVIAQRAARCVHIPPLAGLDWTFGVLNTHPLGLKARRDVRQSARINQLAEDRGRRAGEITQKVHQPKAIEAHPRQHLVVDEVRLLLPLGISLLEVPADGQNRPARCIQRDDIR